MRNPKWQRDEILLALDLYFDPNRGSIDARNPKVIALSTLLNQLPLFTSRPDEERFRNPNGVSLKLSNFLAIDPEYPGKGMQSYSNLDETIFHEFVQDKERLRQIADQIRMVAANETLKQDLSTIESEDQADDYAVQEGEILYRLHKYRERNRKLVAAKKKAVLKATGQLACEICGFDFFKTYGELGRDFIECHHIQPLSSYEANRATSLDDLATVCANCHRMLHRETGSLTVEKLRNELNY